MFKPGDWSTLMLPVHEHLPMLDASGPGYLKRNFSALGFSCDNWQNETITLTILPVSLRGACAGVERRGRAHLAVRACVGWRLVCAVLPLLPMSDR